ncbi:MAG: hypothetical protein ACK5NK_13620 [Niabella sp.]
MWQDKSENISFYKKDVSASFFNTAKFSYFDKQAFFTELLFFDKKITGI